MYHSANNENKKKRQQVHKVGIDVLLNSFDWHLFAYPQTKQDLSPARSHDSPRTHWVSGSPRDTKCVKNTSIHVPVNEIQLGEKHQIRGFHGFASQSSYKLEYVLKKN